MIPAGSLKERVQLQRRDTAQDEAGQPIETWQVVDTAWASIRTTSGLEAIKANADVSTVRASIRIRYRTDVDAGMRAVHGNTIYDIKAVLPDHFGKRHVDLVCEVSQ